MIKRKETNLQEIPKYKKKSKHKPVQKAKHKHTYKICLIKDEHGNYYKTEYCTICYKRGDINYFEYEQSSPQIFRMLDNDEVKRKYKDLEVFYVKDILNTKYLDENKKETTN